MANETLDSFELMAYLEHRSRDHTLVVYLLAPAAAHGRALARARLDRFVRRLADADIEAVGTVGDGDPLVAVDMAWNPAFFDEVIVCALPAPLSRWLRIDLPARIAKRTGALVHYVAARRPSAPAVCERQRVSSLPDR